MQKLIIILPLTALVSCISGQKSNCDYFQEDRFYSGRNPEECATIKYECADYWQQFEDDCGCGCYEIGYEKWQDSLLNNPTKDEIDISGMTPFIINDDSVKITFYLRENQKMETVDSKIHFNAAGNTEVLPIGLFVEGYDPDKSTLSGSGCSLSKKGPLYAAKWSNSNEFSIAVSVRRSDNSSGVIANFKFVIVSE